MCVLLLMWYCEKCIVGNNQYVFDGVTEKYQTNFAFRLLKLGVSLCTPSTVSIPTATRNLQCSKAFESHKCMYKLA